MAKKSQNDIFLETLRKLEQENVLKELILVGSWCLPIYKDMYGKNADWLYSTTGNTPTKGRTWVTGLGNLCSIQLSYRG